MEAFQCLEIQLEEIKSATGNFDDSNVIGKGGFGKVYKGVLSHSEGKSMVAFKRLDDRYGQGGAEFWKEVQMLSLYTHENLISLLGFCKENGEKILVYEHASHGSLDQYLSSRHLSWRQRLKICLGSARGLCYLHDPKGSQQRVIHRDIKSSNILIDENWNGKICDMGFSKFGPANQPYTFLATNVVGTPGYVDPLYMETYTLTKESDVYSFGVVLFEVLCGRPCYQYNNNHFHNLVPMWKQSYEEKKLDEIIFQDLKQHMDQRSVETLSDIAYQCLQKSREKRPKMSHVVEKLEIALSFQKSFEEAEPPMDYQEMSRNAVPPLVYRSTDELKMLLSRGILVNGGKTWFFLNKKGEHCEMISAAECFVPIRCPWYYKYAIHVRNKSRFAGVFFRAKCSKFKTHVRTQFLSPHILYTVNLVFDFKFKRVFNCDDYDQDKYNEYQYHRARSNYNCAHYNYQYARYNYNHAHNNYDHARYNYHHARFNYDRARYNSDHPKDHFSISYTLAGETKPSTLWFVDRREDGFFTAELYQFTSDNKNVDLEITFQTTHDLLVEAIEFQPVESVENGGLEDEEVDIQTISHPDTYWEQKLPSNVEQIIKWSKDRMLWTTKKELYFILCKGFPIKKGEEWFSLDKNGKNCHMLSSRLAFQNSEWSWEASPDSRFEEVAFDPHGSFKIKCSSKMLSAQTKYGSYLVYKIQETHPGFELSVRVTCTSFVGSLFENPWHIYMLSPKTPIIRPKIYQNTHNPLNRPQRKGLPQQRNDGWMEVQLREFQTGAAGKRISENLELTFFNMKSQKGLVVKGIEFKPAV